MILLLAAEQNRLLSRRITRFFPLALAALVVVIGVVTWYMNRSEGLDFVSDTLVAPTAGSDDPWSIGGPLSGLIPIMAFVVAASSFGADEKVGMIEQLLTWEPRRTRFLVARVCAGVVSVFGIATLLASFYVALFWGLSAATGTVDGMTSQIWGDLALEILRQGIVGALFFILGLGVAVLTNSSIGSIVGFFIYMAVVEVPLVFLVPKYGIWAPIGNASSFVLGIDHEIANQRDAALVVHHGYIQSGLIVLAWAAVIWLLGAVRFNRRDVD